MRTKILDFLRVHPKILNAFWKLAHIFFALLGIFVPIRKKTVLITSFAGRKFDDSPKALYDELMLRHEFDDWDIVWAFVDPEKFNIPRGRKIQIDSWPFFIALLYSRVWISNSGMDRNIGINRRGTIRIETWHGTPIKKIGIDQNSGILGNYKPNSKVDKRTIRCAQSEFDRDIFIRVFNADKDCFLMCDLPRNDGLLKYTKESIESIKERIGIKSNKKVLLYMPTYREYLVNERNQTYLAPPMDLMKWESELGDQYVLLFRVHYAVSAAMNLIENDFVKDVSAYPCINDLYAVADILVSDYSSAFIDYSILDKPMLCFAYDKEEYIDKRGLYIDLHEELPCPVDVDEESIIGRIKNMDWRKESEKAKAFHMKYAPFAGAASKAVVEKLINSLCR